MRLNEARRQRGPSARGWYRLNAGVGAAAIAATLVAGAVPAAADDGNLGEVEWVDEFEVPGLGLIDESVWDGQELPVSDEFGELVHGQHDASLIEFAGEDVLHVNDVVADSLDAEELLGPIPPVGWLDVRVVVDGPGAAQVTGGFGVTVSCVLDGEPVRLEFPDSWGVPGLDWVLPGTSSWGRVPDGAVCTVTQEDPGFGATVTITGGSGEHSNQVVIQEGVTAEVTITNTFQVGGIEIVKTLSGPGAAMHADGVFEVEILCLPRSELPVLISAGPVVRELRVDTPILLDDLLAGGSCRIWPIGNSGAEEVTVYPSDPDRVGYTWVEVPPGATMTVTIDSRFPVMADEGAAPDDLMPQLPSPEPSAPPLAMLPVTGASAAALAWAAAAVTAVGVLLLSYGLMFFVQYIDAPHLSFLSPLTFFSVSEVVKDGLGILYILLSAVIITLCMYFTQRLYAKKEMIV
ncbi:MAG: DUF5979 domain-containing protein [Promicromonosporaceae bacterium]|nr:DUF5979 domain-containing protein [Promicromonosporaceae bacterium]